MNDGNASSAPPNPVNGKRPVLLTALCLFSFVFFGMIALLLVISLFYAGFFRSLLNTYLAGATLTTSGVFLIIASLFIVYACAFTGTLLMWRLRRKGFYIFTGAVVVLGVFQLFSNDFSFLSASILIILLLLFGLFFRKLH